MYNNIMCYFPKIYYNSQKYWRVLNLAVEPKITIGRILADLILVVRYGIAIRIIYEWEILPDFNLAVVI